MVSRRRAGAYRSNMTISGLRESAIRSDTLINSVGPTKRSIAPLVMVLSAPYMTLAGGCSINNEYWRYSLLP